MIFEFEQKDGLLILGDSFERLKEVRDQFKDCDYENKPAISRIYNKFSGNYFAPTFVKAFNDCPVRSFLIYLEPRTMNPVANLGNAAHKVFQRIVEEKATNRNDVVKITEEEFTNFSLKESQRPNFIKYINNFIKFDDYDGNNIFKNGYQYFNEYFIKEDNLEILGCDLGSCYCLIDRIDINMEKMVINIVDYKTGRISNINNIINNYKNQMITYYWMIRKNFKGFKINVYLYLPENNSYIKVNVDDIEDQSKYIDEIFKFYEEISMQKSLGYFKQTENDYCKYCSSYNICSKITGENCKIIKEVNFDGELEKDGDAEEI